MLIRYGCKLSISVSAPTPVVCMIDVHPEANCELAVPPTFEVLPELPTTSGIDAFGNPIRRMVAMPGITTIGLRGYALVDGQLDSRDAAAVVPPVQELPDDTLTYLNASRYCDSDLLATTAWQLFGSARRDTALVEAICDYTHHRLRFGYPFARADRTASQAHMERVGVCRDFAHLAIALCRALNIPARYVNGYMGDIGVPADPAPMDFNAWFEAYLGDQWYTFDARHNCRRIGRLVIARGRDACDIPMLQTFGPHTLTAFSVVTEKIETVHADDVASRPAAA